MQFEPESDAREASKQAKCTKHKIISLRARKGRRAQTREKGVLIFMVGKARQAKDGGKEERERAQESMENKRLGRSKYLSCKIYLPNKSCKRFVRLCKTELKPNCVLQKRPEKIKEPGFSLLSPVLIVL